MQRTDFLADFQLRPVRPPAGCPFTILGLAVGKGTSPLEVLAAETNSASNVTQVRSVWKARQQGRAAPLILTVLNGERAVLCGPAGDEPSMYPSLEIGQADRICREALEKPDRHAALRWLHNALLTVDTALPGIRNQGLVATHELVVGARRLALWPTADGKARPLLRMYGDELLRALGYKIEGLDRVTSILRAGPNASKTAIAILLRHDEAAEISTPRFTGLSPVSYALAVADREQIPYVIISQGSMLRLYSSQINIGVGRRGRTETYVEVHTGLLRDSDAAFLWLLFSAEALTSGGSVQTLLEESTRFAGHLAVRLRERIYGSVIPRLVKGIAAARNLKKPTVENLRQTYGMATMVLFRLLFIAYAEDKDLLPFKTNQSYKARSLKGRTQQLLKEHSTVELPDKSCTLWEEISLLFHAVDEGKPEWGVPAYDGGLFSRDKDVSPLGALLETVSLPNEIVRPALYELFTIQTDEGPGPVDFRSLNVGEFGTIYQGLLESELAVAESDLVVDREGFYRPRRAREMPVVRRGEIYIHNRSGARKSTGSYFTQEFAVTHLLDTALEPALAAHCSRLDALDDEAAAAAFFDFCVADIAMGSGHFLVASVDRIERVFTGYLAKRRLPGVRRELARLQATARQTLGSSAEYVEIEDTQLIRRLIARRCIYGVDINPIAVDLARLSLWIHTFVPGLPLCLLERNLIVGNSLIGIGQLSEIEDLPLLSLNIAKAIGEGMEPRKKLAALADASMTEVATARQAMLEAKEAAKPATALCDLVAASRLLERRLDVDLTDWQHLKRVILTSKEHRQATAALKGLHPLHFPVAFPEVFLRPRAGFDVIVGNPPWEKVRVEEHEFWSRHAPGIRGLGQAERDRLISTLKRDRPDLAGLWEEERDEAEKMRNVIRNLPGMNTGHPDLFRAFTSRFVQLVCPSDAYVGVVLPGDAFKVAGAADVRRELAARCTTITVQMLTNKGGWVFQDVHAAKLIALVSLKVAPSDGNTSFHIGAEFHSKTAWNDCRVKDDVVVSLRTLTAYSPTLVVPLLPQRRSLAVVERLMRSPALLSHPVLRVRRVYADFETSKKDKAYWHQDHEHGDWPVYAGESFDIWRPDTGAYYGWTDGTAIVEAAHMKWNRAPRGSPYADLPKTWRQNVKNHPIHYPRIAFRDVTNRTNTRTFVAALVPPKIVTVQTAPWVLWLDPGHPRTQEAFLLGVLCSLPLDWWCRRFIEGHADQEAFNCLRIPDPRCRPKLADRATLLAGRLAAIDKRFAEWADNVGVDCGPVDQQTQTNHVHELDAIVAHLYGLTEKELRHIFQTFHEGWDYADDLASTIDHFRIWAKQ